MDDEANDKACPLVEEQLVLSLLVFEVRFHEVDGCANCWSADCRPSLYRIPVKSLEMRIGPQPQLGGPLDMLLDFLFRGGP